MNNYSQVYKPGDTFHLEQLKKESQYVISYLKSLHEEIEEKEKYLSEITNRAAAVMQYDYYFKVRITRREGYSDKKIFYEISVIKAVKGLEERNTSMQVDFHKTNGRNGKKEAIQKANEFKSKYNAIDIIKNF